MELPTFTNRKAQVVYSAMLAAVLGLVVSAAVASVLIDRYYRDQGQKARCQYLGRLLAAELNRPAAQDLIEARCLQSK